MQNHDVRADSLYRLKLMRAEKNHLASTCRTPHQTAQQERRAHIETGKRFVQQHQLWIVQERSRKQSLLPHPFRSWKSPACQVELFYAAMRRLERDELTHSRWEKQFIADGEHRNGHGAPQIMHKRYPQLILLIPTPTTNDEVEHA